MICQRCGKEEIIKVDAKCSDMCFVEFKGHEKSGYVPHDLGIGGGDYIRMSVCISCGQVQDTFPKQFLIESEEVE